MVPDSWTLKSMLQFEKKSKIIGVKTTGQQLPRLEVPQKMDLCEKVCFHSALYLFFICCNIFLNSPTDLGSMLAFLIDPDHIGKCYVIYPNFFFPFVNTFTFSIYQ